MGHESNVFLAHYGILGMKWGKHKAPSVEVSDRVVVVKKGETSQHVSSNNNLKLNNKHVYTSHTERDRAYYNGTAAQMMLMFQGGANSYTLKAATDLVTPTRQKEIDEFLKFRMNQPIVISEMAAASARLTGRNETKIAKQYDKLAVGNAKKQAQLTTEFVSKLPFISEKTQTEYFKSLAAQGYNAIYDRGDMRVGVEAPLIVFDAKKSYSVVNKKALSPYEIQTNIRMRPYIARTR